MGPGSQVACSTRVVGLLAEPIHLPLTEPFSIAQGAQTTADNVLVRLELEDGTVGLGEAAPFPAVSGETQESALSAIERGRPCVIGRDARSWRSIAQNLRSQLGSQPAACAGVEMALLDAWCRHHRVPLWSMFGGALAPLETDMTVTAGNLEHAVAAARAVVDRGISAIKVKIGAASPQEDAERLFAVHAAAPQARLLVDANGGYAPDEALDFLHRVEARNVALALFEQPVAREDWQGLARVTREGGVRVCADESARSASDVLRIARERCAHAINIKLMKCGVAEALDMWSIAQAAGLALMIGGMVESVLAMTFSAHLAAGLGGFEFVDLDTPMFIAEHPFRGGFRQTGGRLDVAHVEAGHGVDLR